MPSWFVSVTTFAASSVSFWLMFGGGASSGGVKAAEV